jgi:hypothetical protein
MAIINIINRMSIKPVQKNTNILIGDSKVIELVYPRNEKKQYTKENIKELVQKQQQKYAGNPLTFMICTNIKGRGWRSSKQFEISSNLILNDAYDDDEDDSVPQFIIYVWKTKAKKGGDTKYNDCLFICLLKTLNKEGIKESWNTPSKFKKRLQLERDEKVPINKIPFIETNLKININVTGDVTYASSHTYTQTINLKLLSEHYTINHIKQRSLLKKLPTHEQLIHFCYKNDDGTFKTYDGSVYGEITSEDYYNSLKKYNGKISYIKRSNSNTIE